MLSYSEINLAFPEQVSALSLAYGGVAEATYDWTASRRLNALERREG